MPERLTKGKQGELYVFGELLRRGVIPYVPLVDTEGVDAIIRRAGGTYLELQIKTVATPKTPRWFQVANLKPRPSLYIIGVALRENQEVWVIPSQVFAEYATVSHTKQGAKIYDFDLNGGRKKYGVMLRDKLAQYRNAWQLVTGPTEAALGLHPVEAPFAEDWSSAEDSAYNTVKEGQ